MIFGNHKVYTTYIVTDLDSNHEFRWETAKLAMDCKKEFVETFEMDENSITVVERKYDSFGNFEDMYL